MKIVFDIDTIRILFCSKFWGIHNTKFVGFCFVGNSGSSVHRPFRAFFSLVVRCVYSTISTLNSK